MKGLTLRSNLKLQSSFDIILVKSYSHANTSIHVEFTCANQSKVFFNSQFQFQIKLKCHILYHNGTEQCISMQFSYIYIILCNFSYTHSGIIATQDSGSTVSSGWDQSIPSCQELACPSWSGQLATGDELIPTTVDRTARVQCCIH